MKKEFEEYLESIGITKIFRKRIETIYKFYAKICPDEITGMFVSDYVKEDGSREYENLWFFSLTYLMEADAFITKDVFDITSIRNRIEYWEIKKQDYDFEKATEKSRFYLEIRLDTGAIGSFKASKENCDYLKDILFKHISPNLKK